jgi:hypothetical protein
MFIKVTIPSEVQEDIKKVTLARIKRFGRDKDSEYNALLPILHLSGSYMPATVVQEALARATESQDWRNDMWHTGLAPSSRVKEFLASLARDADAQSRGEAVATEDQIYVENAATRAWEAAAPILDRAFIEGEVEARKAAQNRDLLLAADLEGQASGRDLSEGVGNTAIDWVASFGRPMPNTRYEEALRDANDQVSVAVQNELTEQREASGYDNRPSLVADRHQEIIPNSDQSNDPARGPGRELEGAVANASYQADKPANVTTLLARRMAMLELKASESPLGERIKVVQVEDEYIRARDVAEYKRLKLQAEGLEITAADVARERANLERDRSIGSQGHETWVDRVASEVKTDPQGPGGLGGRR